MSAPGINHSVPKAFVVLFHSAAFKAKFNSSELPVIRLFEWVEKAGAPVAMEIMAGMEFKMSRGKAAPKESLL